MFLDDLSFDVIDIISSYLHIKEFYRMRLSSQKLSAPNVPSLHFELYRASTVDCNIKCPLKLIRLHRSSVHAESLCFLAEKKHCTELISILKSKQGMKLPSSITQKVFKASFKNCYYPKTFSSNSDGFYTREEFLERFSDDYYPDLIMTLLKHGSVDPSDDDSSSFVSACFYGHLEAVEWMLQDERVVPSAYANSGFILACSSGNSKIVELLLKDERIDPSDQENESIGVACEYGNLEVVKLLLQDGRVVPQITHEDEGHFDNMHQSALVRACESNKIHIVKYLLQSERVTVSLYENVALRSAIVAGHHECVKELLNDPALDLSLYPDSEPDIVTLAKNSGDSTILNLILKLQMKRNHIHKCNQ